MTAETWTWLPGDLESFSLHTHLGCKPQPYLPEGGVWCLWTLPCDRGLVEPYKEYETVVYRIINGKHGWKHGLGLYHTWEEAVEGHINTCRYYEIM